MREMKNEVSGFLILIKFMKRKFIQRILKSLSQAILKKYQPLIIAVIGSTGKTSTKEAIYCVLKDNFQVGKNELNLNTEIGAPLTLILGKNAKRNIFLWLYNFLKAFFLIIFPYKKYPKIWILEMSEDRPGILTYLFNLTQPKIVVLSWIGEIPVHIANYPSLNAYKKEIISCCQKLKADDVLVLNTDSFLFEEIKEKSSAKIITYGIFKKADFSVTNYKLILNEEGEIEMHFRLETQDNFLPVKIKNIFSQVYLYPLLSAIVIGDYFNLNLLTITNALENYKVPKGRPHLIEGKNGSLIFNDSYNANPDSTLAALNSFQEVFEVLKEKKNLKRKILVLGDMLELGEYSSMAHQKIGEETAKIGDYFFSVGKEMKLTGEIFSQQKGEDKVFFFEDSSSCAKAIETFIQTGDFVLVKGSRGMHLEIVTQKIMAHPEQAKELLTFDITS